jgi:hypothetical protein
MASQLLATPLAYGQTGMLPHISWTLATKTRCSAGAASRVSGGIAHAQGDRGGVPPYIFSLFRAEQRDSDAQHPAQGRA